MVPVPKTGTPRDPSLTPISVMIVKTIGGVTLCQILKILFDPGSTKTLIHRSVVPNNALPQKLGATKRISTLAGNMTAGERVILRDLRLPEFDKNCSVNEQSALIFDKKIRYDVILGIDFLTK